jgi:hypothetical protein
VPRSSAIDAIAAFVCAAIAACANESTLFLELPPATEPGAIVAAVESSERRTLAADDFDPASPERTALLLPLEGLGTSTVTVLAYA